MNLFADSPYLLGDSMDSVATKKRGRPRIELEGRSFGRLNVVRFSHSTKTGAHWICRCDCGGERTIQASVLVGGQAVSCGCHVKKKEPSIPRMAKAPRHGMSTIPEYRIWVAMKRRCTVPSDPHYPAYGGRGITFDPSWGRFQAFIEDMGRRPSPLHSLDRRDNSAGYIKTNCRWATRLEQANNRRSNRRIDCFGKSLTAAEWSRELGCREKTLRQRVFLMGWSPERALTTPVRRSTR